MTDNKAKQSEQEESKITSNPAGKTAPRAQKSQQFSQVVHQLPAWSWVVIVFFGFFAVFGCVAASYAAVHSFKNGDADSAKSRGIYSLRDDQVGGGLRGGMQRGNVGNDMMGDGLDAMRTTNERVRGVVTAVDGTTLTVAGNGKTVTVKVTDSTTYTGSSKPAAVNDTIIAFGSTSDGVFTATSVRLTRQ